MLNTLNERIENGQTLSEDAAVDYLIRQGVGTSRFCVVLGTGFGSFVDSVSVRLVIPYCKIPGFPVSTVEGHAGNLIKGVFADQELVVLQGRFHLYEGYTPEQIAFPFRLLKRIGVKILILTNAAGGLNSRFQTGEFMVVDDHLHGIPHRAMARMSPGEPLNPVPYSQELITRFMQTSHSTGIQVQRGVLAWMPGPSLETRAEITMLRQSGADAITMSTIPEAMAAIRLNFNILGLSCLSNNCIGVIDASITASDVLSVVSAASDRFAQLMRVFISSWSESPAAV